MSTSDEQLALNLMATSFNCDATGEASSQVVNKIVMRCLRDFFKEYSPIEVHVPSTTRRPGAGPSGLSSVAPSTPSFHCRPVSSDHQQSFVGGISFAHTESEILRCFFRMKPFAVFLWAPTWMSQSAQRDCQSHGPYLINHVLIEMKTFELRDAFTHLLFITAHNKMSICGHRSH